VAKRHPDLLFDPDTDTDPDPDFIRFAQMTAERIINLYDLADAAYDAKEIREMSARLGHVAIIDHNARYNERTAVDRVNSHLHEEHGGRHVRNPRTQAVRRSVRGFARASRKKRKALSYWWFPTKQGLKLVGEGGFEPPTFWSRTKRATRLRYSPMTV
jgi:hypothetical protein